jgi:hypothetical protein
METQTGDKTMTPKTEAKLNEILEAGKFGQEIYPAFFQRFGMGIDASVSAAIRVAKKRGLIEQAGIDGMGKPKYRVVMPAATHTAPAVAQ